MNTFRRNGFTYDLWFKPWRKGKVKHEALKWKTGDKNTWERISYAEYLKAKNNIMEITIVKTVDAIRIDIDNMIEDLRQERSAWRDRFEEADRLRLKELVVISKKLNRLSRKLNKNINIVQSV